MTPLDIGQKTPTPYEDMKTSQSAPTSGRVAVEIVGIIGLGVALVALYFQLKDRKKPPHPKCPVDQTPAVNRDTEGHWVCWQGHKWRAAQ